MCCVACEGSKAATALEQAVAIASLSTSDSDFQAWSKTFGGETLRQDCGPKYDQAHQAPEPLAMLDSIALSKDKESGTED